MSRSLGIPVKLLHEAAGHVVTVELKTGEVYRGSMLDCEDNWNCQLHNPTFTAKVRAPPCLRIGGRSPSDFVDRRFLPAVVG
jgi:small nuclear ribonucleoprotein (snRNP)-like protein